MEVEGGKERKGETEEYEGFLGKAGRGKTDWYRGGGGGVVEMEYIFFNTLSGDSVEKVVSSDFKDLISPSVRLKLVGLRLFISLMNLPTCCKQ